MIFMPFFFHQNICEIQSIQQHFLYQVGPEFNGLSIFCIRSLLFVSQYKRNDFSTDIYLFRINHGNIKAMCEIRSSVVLKTPERRQWRLSSVFIVNCENTSHIFLVLPFLTLNK